MAINSEAGHNSANSVMGGVTLEFSEDLGLQLHVHGIMNNPAFLEMAIGYLRQYIDRRWEKEWKEGGNQ